MKIGLLLFAVLVLGVFLVACAPTPKVVEESAVEENAVLDQDLTIKITADGFEPKTLTVKTGTTVTFVNEDSDKHWPASAMHPTHAVYPGSNIEKCGTEEKIFDACKSLEQGESFSFTFNEKGSWRYHDHLSISSTGTIVVE
ncbi:MAG: cupredoxin domain-containing protein [Nanoarchaeota archaeon]